MDIIRDMATVLVVFSMAVFLQCSTSTASPIQRRSVQMNPNEGYLISDGLVKDMMFLTSDADRDGKLSSAEIAFFYNQIVGYQDYPAALFGDSFVEHGDLDGDQLLDEQELLDWLHIFGTRWTRRR